jgi:hypothetical protein
VPESAIERDDGGIAVPTMSLRVGMTATASSPRWMPESGQAHPFAGTEAADDSLPARRMGSGMPGISRLADADCAGRTWLPARKPRSEITQR